ncbi:MAG: helix-turn-helix domain-containing protein [Candidatus Falkowbacteria bacterium]
MTKIIKTKKAYKAALARVDKIFDARAGSTEADELELLSLLIEHYEAEHYPILAPDPIEAIRFRMEALGLEQKDVAKLIGANRVSEIFSGKRPLSIGMIKTLHTKLNIPVEFLIGC